tara:strand:+ start:107 stop:325 length:219 start_codon:yes stop_codon:yes gene_type:complete
MSQETKISVVTEEGRECTICNEFKKWGCFYNLKNGINGKYARCMECVKHRRKLKEEGKDVPRIKSVLYKTIR